MKNIKISPCRRVAGNNKPIFIWTFSYKVYIYQEAWYMVLEWDISSFGASTETFQRDVCVDHDVDELNLHICSVPL